jgi:hypothetical protein
VAHAAERRPNWNVVRDGAPDTRHDITGGAVTMFVPLLTRDQIEALPGRAREVVEYRKSGLSLNHVQGLPAGLCLLHPPHVRRVGYGPARALTDDASAVWALVEHPYFQPNVAPIQVFNRATDPMREGCNLADRVLCVGEVAVEDVGCGCPGWLQGVRQAVPVARMLRIRRG